MKRFFFTLIYSLILSCAAFAGGDGGVEKVGNSLFDAWNTNQNLNIELHVNFDSLEVYRKKVEFLPAKVIQNGKRLDLEVAVRGKFRRRNCAMPPLKLKFKKDGLRANGFNTHNDFKLVTHCTDDAAGQDALLREQLAYELYNTVNPDASFRTQLLTITYVNTADGGTTTSYAILIEDADELKDRLDTRNCKECYNMPAAQITNAEQVTLFQYMIGNADFGTRMIRNLKLLKGDDGRNTFVPYDFDYSGLVNATYVKPNAQLGQRKITDRILIWEFEASPDFTAAADHMISLKDTLLTQVADFDGLSNASKREVSKYLKSFYKDLKTLDLTTPKPRQERSFTP